MTYQPFDIGTKFRIIPPDTVEVKNGYIDLIMQRGAFGSGEHETTESCLECMAQMSDLSDARVLDLGSGTGILAIAALKLGAEHAVCVDIEAQAVATAQSNCLLNDTVHRTTHITGTLEDVKETGFDLTLANIYGDILLSVAPDLVTKTRIGGQLILSGILWEYNFDVRQAYERLGCKVRQNIILEEFSTILLTRLK